MVATILVASLFAAGPKPVVITKAPTAPIKLVIGQTLKFYVQGTPSTGAGWSVDKSGKPGLKYIGIVEEARKPTKRIVLGAPEHYTLSFKAVKKGKYAVALKYGRSWEMEKGAKPWGDLKATVIIH